MLPSLSLLFLLGLTAQTPAPANPAAVIAPLVGHEVAAVVHVDLNRLDFQETVKKLAGAFATEKQFARSIDSANSVVDSLKKANARELFVMIDPSDYPNLPLFVFTLKPGSDPKPLQNVIQGLLPQYGLKSAVVEVIGDLVVGGPPQLVAFARMRKYPPRADLAAALAASDNAPAKILIIPSFVQRKALEESITTLPREFGGGPITTFTQGLIWATLMLNSGDQPSLKLRIQGKDAATAGQLADLARHSKAFAAERAKQDPLTAPFAGMVDNLNLQTIQDQVIMEISPGQMAELFIPLAQAVQETSRRAECVKNLKQIGLAMLNYHEANKAFPRQATLDKSCQPLLSWRVQILPFLDQQELYNQFHLDEPWDSPHNKSLISKMPAVFACPSSKHAASEGKTCYLVPHGERTILSGKQGGRLQDVFDGTTRTMMAAEMGDDAAVIWSKPDDWQIGGIVDFKPLLGHHPGGTNILFADSSLRFVKQTISREVLKALITRDGGEVINPDAF